MIKYGTSHRSAHHLSDGLFLTYGDHATSSMKTISVFNADTTPI